MEVFNKIECVVCKFDLAKAEKLFVKEMMQGTRAVFEYYICNNCKAIQISSPPTDMDSFYTNYYTDKKIFNQISKFRKNIWKIRRFISLSFLHNIINKISFNTILNWARIANLNINSKILDVGCGNGDLLFEFSKHGFKSLYGIDPNLKAVDRNDFNLVKTDLLNFNPNHQFDLIIFNHSFEHIYNQTQTFRKAIELLAENGVILIRTPIVNRAYELYKEHWVQIDAPRHFIIHSLKSIKMFCRMNGGNIYNHFFDSTAFQFLGSEQFKAGISSYAPNSYKVDLNQSQFSSADIKAFEIKARKLNKEGLGDQATFFIRRIT